MFHHRSIHGGPYSCCFGPCYVQTKIAWRNTYTRGESKGERWIYLTAAQCYGGDIDKFGKNDKEVKWLGHLVINSLLSPEIEKTVHRQKEEVKRMGKKLSGANEFYTGYFAQIFTDVYG